jgi:hypothetical protein
MATRVNMMRLLQQARGMAEMIGPKPAPRPPGPLLLQVRAPKWKNATPKPRHIIRIDMQESPDIPHPVTILHLDQAQNPTAANQSSAS